MWRMPGMPLDRRRSASGRHPAVARGRFHADPHPVGSRPGRGSLADRAWPRLQGGHRCARRSDESLRGQCAAQDARRAAEAHARAARDEPAVATAAYAAQPLFAPAARRAVASDSRGISASARGAGPWAEALAATGAGPFALLDADPAALAQLRNDTIAHSRDIGSGNLQPPAVADRWARGELAIRLSCLESWVTERILETASIRDVTHLSGAALPPKICRLFEFSDAIRDMRKLAHTSINKTMAVEALLWRWARQ